MLSTGALSDTLDGRLRLTSGGFGAGTTCYRPPSSVICTSRRPGATTFWAGIAASLATATAAGLDSFFAANLGARAREPAPVMAANASSPEGDRWASRIFSAL